MTLDILSFLPDPSGGGESRTKILKHDETFGVGGQMLVIFYNEIPQRSWNIFQTPPPPPTLDPDLFLGQERSQKYR